MQHSGQGLFVGIRNNHEVVQRLSNNSEKIFTQKGSIYKKFMPRTYFWFLIQLFSPLLTSIDLIYYIFNYWLIYKEN